MNWLTTVSHTIVGTPSIGPDGTVFIGEGAYLCAVNPDNGGIEWSYQTSGLIYGAPAIGSDDTVYIGSGNGIMYAVNGKTGKLKWSYQATGTIVSSPTIDSNNVVYFGDWESNSAGHLYAIQGASGALVWSIRTAGISSSPALGDNQMLYIGACDDNLYALKSSNASMVWSYTMGGHIESAPAIGPDGSLYVSCDDGFLYALNSNGVKLWDFEFGGPIAFAPTLVRSPAVGSNGIVYIGGDDGQFFLLSASTGEIVNSFKASAPIQGSPAIGADGTVYIGPSDGNVYAVDGQTGQLIWSQNFGFCQSSPAIGNDGSLYVAVNDGLQLLSVPSAHLTSIAPSQSSIIGGNSFSATITLSAPAPIDERITLTCTNPAVQLESTALVTKGHTTTTAFITTTGVNSSTTGTMSANLNGITVSTPFTVNPAGLTSLSVNPASVVGGDSVSGSVTLNGAAGSSGVVVNLQSSSGFAQVPETVTVTAGNTSANFSISTPTVTTNESATITATSGGANFSAPLTVTPLILVGFTAGLDNRADGTYTVKVTLNGNVPSGSAVVHLSSSAVQFPLPATVTIPAGSSAATLTVTALPVAKFTTVNLNATLDQVNLTTTVILSPPDLVGIVFSPSAVLGGSTSNGVVTVSSAAPQGGLSISLRSSVSSASVPSKVTVPAGMTSVSFFANTKAVSAVTDATITADLNGEMVSKQLEIDPTVKLVSVTFSPSTIVAGNSTTGTVTLSGAVQSSVTVTLKSSSAITLPSSLTFTTGQSSATFLVTTSTSLASGTVTVAAGLEKTSIDGKFKVDPIQVASLTLNPSTVTVGGTSVATVTLNTAAPTSGFVVPIVSKSLAASVPASVLIGSGQTSAQFTVTAVKSSLDPVAIVAGTSKSSKSANLTIVTHVAIQSFTLSPDTVLGGATVKGVITLTEAAPATEHVILSGPSGLRFPTSVAINKGASAATIQIVTSSVSSSQALTISASLNGQVVPATLTVNPLQIVSVTVNPSAVASGGSATGTVTLSGVVNTFTPVSLSSNSSAITIPSSVTISPGKSSATFSIHAQTVHVATVVTITATENGTQQAVLTVEPGVQATLTLDHTSFVGGSPITGTVTLNEVAPTSQTVHINSNSSAISGAVITIPANSSSASVKLTSRSVSQDTDATLSVLIGDSTTTTSVTLIPLAISSLTFTNPIVTAGGSVTGTVTLNAKALTSTKVTLSGEKTFDLPASIIIAAGSSSATFTFSAKATVTKATQFDISASLPSGTVTEALTVVPLDVIVSMTLEATSKPGVYLLTVITSGAASDVVALSSSSDSIKVPATMRVAGGTGSITVTAFAVTSTTVVTITGSLNGSNGSATVTLTP